jgi:hypothetical protein
MRRALACWLALASVAAGSACSRNQPPAAFDPAAPVVLVVRNNNVQDVDVFATGDGGRRRLGTVVAHTEQTYVLEADFISGTRLLQLVAEPIASRASRIQARVGVQPGQEVRWTLESSLQRSYVSVR